MSTRTLLLGLTVTLAWGCGQGDTVRTPGNDVATNNPTGETSADPNSNGNSGMPDPTGDSDPNSPQIDPPSAPPGVDFSEGCTPGTLPRKGTLNGRWGSLKTTVNGQEYFLQVNEWGASAPQTMAYGEDVFFRMTQQESAMATNGAPTGFPSVFIGANSGNSTANSGLPRQISSLNAVPTTLVWEDDGTLADTETNSYNVTYDVWFSRTEAGDPDSYSPSGAFLMVQLYDPPDAQPIGGAPREQDVAVAGIPGTWDIWVGLNGATPIISYVATEPMMALSFDLNHFITDAVENRPDTLTADMYLSNVFAGFEIWRGGEGIAVKQFCAEVQ